MELSVNERLLLRTYSAGDAPALSALINLSRGQLQQWLPWVAHIRTEADALYFIRKTKQQQATQSGITMAIFRDGLLAGGITMQYWDHELQSARLGFWIGKPYEGQGLVSEALTRFIDFLFGHTAIQKLEIRFVPENKRSAAVATRMGFRPEGVLRHSYRHNGRATDLVVTGLLRTEW